MKRIVWITVCLALSTSLWAGLDEDLFEAVNKGDKKKVVALIKKGANVNAKSKDGGRKDMTPLHIASQGVILIRDAKVVWVEEDHIEITRLLIEKGANVNAKSKGGWTSLHISVEHGYSEITRLLVRKGADIWAKTKDGYTVFHSACQGRLKWFVEDMIQKGANVNAKAKNGFTALHGATMSGDIEIVKLLIQKGADVNAKFFRPLFWLLLQAEGPNGTPLHIAAYKGHIEIARLLIQKKANVSVRAKNGETPLMNVNGHAGIARLLIGKGADVKAKAEDGFTALHAAVMNGDIEIVKLLIQKGADVKAKSDRFYHGRDWTPLHYVVVSVPKDFEDSNIMNTSLKRNIEIAKLLIKNGADVNSKTSQSETPLDVAWNDEMIKFLRKAGGKRGEEIK